MYKRTAAILVVIQLLCLCMAGYAETTSSLFITPPPATGESTPVPVLAGAEQAGQTQAPVAQTQAPQSGDVDGYLRIWLQSLGTRTALGLTLDGAYSVDGDRGFQFEQGTEIALGLDGGHIVLKAGGLTIDMGGSFTLERHLSADGSAGGVYIHESEYDTLYAGDLTIAARNDSIRVTLNIQIEDYLYGVVPHEMSNSFPLEALKAQAVAARTYAMQRKTRNTAQEYDLADTPNDQVYKGLDTRYATAIQAVNETRGMVGIYNGTYAECFYSSSNGGQTVLPSDIWGNGDFPYFDIHDDPYDLENPKSVKKSAVIPKDASTLSEPLYGMILESVAGQLAKEGIKPEDAAIGLAEITGVEGVEPLYGGGSRQYGTVRFTVKPSLRRYSGTATDTVRTLGELEVLDKAYTVDLSFYDQVRTALGVGINSSKYELFTVEANDTGFVFTTRRFGHGIGMSQYGAQTMASSYDKTYLEILNFYYPGLQFEERLWMLKALTSADQLPESLGYAAARPTPAPTPGPLPALKGTEYYAVVTVEGVDGTLNVRAEPSLDSAVLGQIRNGARMIVEEELEDGWAKMRTAELEGYVSMGFIAKE